MFSIIPRIMNPPCQTFLLVGYLRQKRLKDHTHLLTSVSRKAKEMKQIQECPPSIMASWIDLAKVNWKRTKRNGGKGKRRRFEKLFRIFRNTFSNFSKYSFEIFEKNVFFFKCSKTFPKLLEDLPWCFYKKKTFRNVRKTFLNFKKTFLN